MPRKRLFNTKRATGTAGKSGSAADASVSSPEAKKPSSASASHHLLELRFWLKFQKSDEAPQCQLAL